MVREPSSEILRMLWSKNLLVGAVAFQRDAGETQDDDAADNEFDVAQNIFHEIPATELCRAGCEPPCERHFCGSAEAEPDTLFCHEACDGARRRGRRLFRAAVRGKARSIRFAAMEIRAALNLCALSHISLFSFLPAVDCSLPEGFFQTLQKQLGGF